MNAVNQIGKLCALAALIMGLSACSIVSNNDGYQGGDHRGGGPTGVLTGTTSAEKIAQPRAATNSDEEVYTGGDHRGGGPTGPLSKQ